MANRKKEVYKPKPMTEGKRNLIQGLLREYDIETAEDIQDAFKDLLSGTVKEIQPFLLCAGSNKGTHPGRYSTERPECLKIFLIRVDRENRCLYSKRQVNQEHLPFLITYHRRS